MKRTYFIYKLIAPNKKVYIGQTYNINRRFSCYRNLSCKQQQKLYSSIKKYGWENFTKIILYDLVCDKSQIDKIEDIEIKKYIKLGLSLNIQDSVKSPFYNVGNLHPRSKAVIQFDSKLNIIKEFENASIAAKKLGFPQSSISKACRTSKANVGNYYFRFKENYTQEELIRISEIPHALSEPIIQLSKDGTFIKEWDSQSKASKTLNINQANIWRVMCNKGITAGGYKWIKKQNYDYKK